MHPALYPNVSSVNDTRHNDSESLIDDKTAASTRRHHIVTYAMIICVLAIVLLGAWTTSLVTINYYKHQTNAPTQAPPVIQSIASHMASVFSGGSINFFNCPICETFFTSRVRYDYTKPPFLLIQVDLSGVDRNYLQSIGVNYNVYKNSTAFKLSWQNADCDVCNNTIQKLFS